MTSLLNRLFTWLDDCMVSSPVLGYLCLVIIGSPQEVQSFEGVYQIGEVYARSCILVGTPSGRFTPKNFAS